jgi:hypothetical protein
VYQNVFKSKYQKFIKLARVVIKHIIDDQKRIQEDEQKFIKKQRAQVKEILLHLLTYVKVWELQSKKEAANRNYTKSYLS